ncbi:hypothetical protein [Paraburkholderia adhaesiva]|nr:hypothetical protein [Paraburkholderia adhaesiva]
MWTVDRVRHWAIARRGFTALREREADGHCVVLRAGIWCPGLASTSSA